MYDYELSFLPQLAAARPAGTKGASETAPPRRSCQCAAKQPADKQPANNSNNSALVRQRASAKCCLAAASLQAAASLPLVMAAGGPNGSPATPPVLNTALRAEQRRQQASVVSVVRPVPQRAPGPPSGGRPASPQKLLDELLASQWLSNETAGCGGGGGGAEPLAGAQPELSCGQQQQQQQLALARREQHELGRLVRRQHQWVLAALERRRRQLEQVRAVWHHKDFKRAIERLVQLYESGLEFEARELRSAHAGLVADVLGVLVTRPSLWTLDTCQQLLPIVAGDLLAARDPLSHEPLVRAGLDALLLVATHFGPLIRSLAGPPAAPDPAQGAHCAPGPVDLSREERVARCVSCARLLGEAAKQVRALAKRLPGSRAPHLARMCQQLEQLFQRFGFV